MCVPHAVASMWVGADAPCVRREAMAREVFGKLDEAAQYTTLLKKLIPCTMSQDDSGQLSKAEFLKILQKMNPGTDEAVRKTCMRAHAVTMGNATAGGGQGIQEGEDRGRQDGREWVLQVGQCGPALL